METLELLQEFIQRRIGKLAEPLTLESNLEAVGVDSLMLLDLMFDLEDKYNVRMPDDLPRPQTVGDLIAIFDKLKPSSASNE